MANGMFAGGRGTEENPYLIEDIEDLSAIRNNPGACYRLISNINMNIYPYNEGAGWNPIDGFCGTLDGDGYIISNLYINRPDIDDVGLFGKSTSLYNEDFFKNLILDNVNITGRDNVAALLGNYDSWNGTHKQASNNICNIFISGLIKGNDNVSGLLSRTTNIPYLGVYSGVDSYINFTSNVIINAKITSNKTLSILSNTSSYSEYYNYSVHYATRACRFCNSLVIFDANSGYSKINEDYGYATKTKCYYLKDNLKVGQYISNNTTSGMQGLSKSEMYSKSYDMFSGLIEARTTSGYNFFEFNYGCPPTYNHKRHKAVLVEYDGKYHTYNHKNNQWVELDNNDPLYLANNSINGLDIIPNTSWDEIKDKSPVVVNIVPQINKYAKHTDSLKLTHSDTDSVLLNSAEKCIARTKITLNDDDKFLEQIDT